MLHFTTINALLLNNVFTEPIYAQPIHITIQFLVYSYMFWSSVTWCNVVRGMAVQVLEKPATSNIFVSVKRGSMFPQNSGSYLPDYMVPHP